MRTSMAALFAVHPILHGTYLHASQASRRNSGRNANRLVEVACLDQHESRNLFVGFGKWAIGDRDLAVSDPHRGRRLKGCSGPAAIKQPSLRMASSKSSDSSIRSRDS